MLSVGLDVKWDARNMDGDELYVLVNLIHYCGYSQVSLRKRKELRGDGGEISKAAGPHQSVQAGS